MRRSDPLHWARWKDEAAALLASNQVQVEGHRYTRPAPMVYEQQWLWDSCFHAIAYRWIDPAMARDELLSVVARQVTEGPDAGMIPHVVHWQRSDEALWGRPDRSVITQPPLVAIAAQMVFEVTHDRDLLARLYPRLCAYHAWLTRRRDPDGDHLASIIHPWESGWDAAPRWDGALGLTCPTDAEARTARYRLAAEIVAHDGDAVALAQAGQFHAETLDFNSIRAADLEALSAIARALGKADAARQWQQQARAVQAAAREKLVGAGTCDLFGLDEKPSREASAALFVALFGGCVGEDQARRLVEWLCEPHHWRPFPVATTPTNAATCAPDRYWRGNVWLPVNWLIYQGLRRYGYDDCAHALAERTAELVARSGFWEYYHPVTGAGLGSRHQSWSALVLDLLATDQAFLAEAELTHRDQVPQMVRAA